MNIRKKRLLSALASMSRQYQASGGEMSLDDSEQELLKALANMADDHLTDGPVLDNLCMSAGEEAMELLAEYGLIDLEEDQLRRGHWTQAGRAMLTLSSSGI